MCQARTSKQANRALLDGGDTWLDVPTKRLGAQGWKRLLKAIMEDQNGEDWAANRLSHQAEN